MEEMGMVMKYLFNQVLRALGSKGYTSPAEYAHYEEMRILTLLTERKR